LPSLQAAIPDQPDLAEFLLDANEAATKAGIDFISLSPTAPGSTPAGATGVPSTSGAGASGAGAGASGAGASGASATGPRATPIAIPVSISVSGGYFQILNYLNRLDRLPRVVVIDSLALAPGGD